MKIDYYYWHGFESSPRSLLCYEPKNCLLLLFWILEKKSFGKWGKYDNLIQLWGPIYTIILFIGVSGRYAEKCLEF